MAKSKRQETLCNALSVLTYAEFMEVARWMATASDEPPTDTEVNEMARRLQNLAENFEV
jgi:hypothetical protein